MLPWTVFKILHILAVNCTQELLYKNESHNIFKATNVTLESPYKLLQIGQKNLPKNFQ